MIGYTNKKEQNMLYLGYKQYQEKKMKDKNTTLSEQNAIE